MRGLGIALLVLGAVMLGAPAALLIWAWTMYSVGVGIHSPLFVGLWIIFSLSISAFGFVILRRAAKTDRSSRP